MHGLCYHKKVAIDATPHAVGITAAHVVVMQTGWQLAHIKNIGNLSGVGYLPNHLTVIVPVNPTFVFLCRFSCHAWNDEKMACHAAPYSIICLRTEVEIVDAWGQ